MNFKKRILSISVAALILSGCNTNNQQSIIQNQTNIETFGNNTQNDEKITRESESEINTIAFDLYQSYFADDIKANKTTNFFSKKAREKGSMLFRLLNKSNVAQKVGYFISDKPVGNAFNKRSKGDNIPRVSASEIQEMKSKLKPGDLILCGNNGSFIHVILYAGNNVIYHALANKVESKDRKFLGVVKETIDSYLKRSSRDSFVVLRYPELNQEDLKRAVDYASKQVGKDYDTLFLLNSDSRFYCTELVYSAIKAMKNGPRVYSKKAKYGWVLIQNEDYMDSPDLITVWERNYKRPKTGKFRKYN